MSFETLRGIGRVVMSLLLIYCTVIAHAESFDLLSRVVRLTVILGAFLALWAVLSHRCRSQHQRKESYSMPRCFRKATWTQSDDVSMAGIILLS